MYCKFLGGYVKKSITNIVHDLFIQVNYERYIFFIFSPEDLSLKLLFLFFSDNDAMFIGLLPRP